MIFKPETLERANTLYEQIRQLDSFIRDLSISWQSQLISETKRMFLKTVPYGPFQSVAIDLDKGMKEKIIFMLDQELKDKRTELASLFAKETEDKSDVT